MSIKDKNSSKDQMGNCHTEVLATFFAGCTLLLGYNPSTCYCCIGAKEGTMGLEPRTADLRGIILSLDLWHSHPHGSCQILSEEFSANQLRKCQFGVQKLPNVPTSSQ